MRIFSEGDIALVLDLGARVNLHGIKFWESKLDNFIAAYTGDKVISARMLDHKWEELCRHYDRDKRNAAWVKAVLKAGHHQEVAAFEASRVRKKALRQQNAQSGRRNRVQPSSARARIQRSTARVSVGHSLTMPSSSEASASPLLGGSSGGNVESAMPGVQDEEHITGGNIEESLANLDQFIPPNSLPSQGIHSTENEISTDSLPAPPTPPTVAKLAIQHMEQFYMELILQQIPDANVGDLFVNLIGENERDEDGAFGPTYAEFYLLKSEADKPAMIIELAGIARARWNLIAQDHARG